VSSSDFAAGTLLQEFNVQVKLFFFAIVREMVGHSEISRELPAGTTVGRMFEQLAEEHPGLTRLRPSLLFMVNEEYAKPERLLHDGDEVALIPPVSGGEVARFRVVEHSINSENVVSLVENPSAGAIATFLGTVRDNARGRAVERLEYEAYAPAAEKMLRQIGDEIYQRWGIHEVAIVHRIGRLEIGEVSVAIAVASAHRVNGFDACRYAIDRIKEIVPIWKKEFYEDGESWIGSEADYQAAFGTSGRSH
jgi:MoaE-MoaD fusion protein